jgi:hypothetical protein
MQKSRQSTGSVVILHSLHLPHARQGQVSGLVHRDIGQLQQRHLGAPRIYQGGQVEHGIPSSTVQVGLAVERLTGIGYLERRPRRHCLPGPCPNAALSVFVIRI